MPQALLQAAPVLSPPGSRPITVLPSTATLLVPSIPDLCLHGMSHQLEDPSTEPLALVLGDSAAYAFVHSGPCVVALLNQIQDFERPLNEDRSTPVWTALDGQPIHSCGSCLQLLLCTSLPRISPGLLRPLPCLLHVQ